MNEKTATLIAQIFHGTAQVDELGAWSVLIFGKDLLGRACELRLDDLGWVATDSDGDDIGQNVTG